MYKELVTDVFFDLDHTLWDFEKNSALTFEKILVEHDIDIELARFLDVYVPANLVFWKLYREEKISKKDLRYQRLKTVFDKLNYRVSDETILSLSEYLKPKYRLHIITNGFQEIQDKKLKNSGIYPFFNKVINSEMAGVKKPNPIIFELALKRAKVTPERSIMIGDSLEADVLGAKGVGLHALHFNSHNEPIHEHCPMIQELWEIKTYL